MNIVPTVQWNTVIRLSECSHYVCLQRLCKVNGNVIGEAYIIRYSLHLTTFRVTDSKLSYILLLMHGDMLLSYFNDPFPIDAESIMLEPASIDNMHG